MIARGFGFALLLLASAAAGDESNTTGVFRVDSADLDLGRVPAGAVATATFIFRNDSAADVRILRAAPS